ncbi:hypothetical protein MPH_13321 [Macrophomina phaseolina MS6]|uniref:Uncharacterized protein n=1 Tax=Macrophomina phaseolina (strain MS6) TaxID=1126212 RepID=K2R634_MACPH|nr:hypothetical protein MPH_13321 [Macrophomina phaseolina MS6]
MTTRPRNLLDWLQQEPPTLATLHNAVTSTAPATRTEEPWPQVKRWTQWEDFSAATLNPLLQDIWNQEYELPASPPPFPAPAQLLIGNERALEFVLIRWHNTVVTVALEAVAARFKKLRPKLLFWASGGSEKSASKLGFPDWAGVPPLPAAPATLPRSACPGESKYTQHSLVSTIKKSQWALNCISQAAFYAIQRETRYFFLFTPHELLVGRYSNPKTPANTPAPPPASPPVSSRTRSGGTVKPAATPPPSSPYSPRTPRADPGDNLVPELAAIRWADRGRGKLSVSQALFSLHLLASLGSNVQDAYEDLAAEYTRPLRDLIRAAS